jgi:GxxExxY protein
VFAVGTRIFYFLFFIFHDTMEKLLHGEITEGIINAYYDVYNAMGYGFLEKVYQNSMYLELKQRGFEVEAQRQIKVFYKGVNVGEYYADLLVNSAVIVELKAIEWLIPENGLQLMNYLRATEIELGLLLNFGKKPEFERIIFTNDRKKHLIHTKNHK